MRQTHIWLRALKTKDARRLSKTPSEQLSANSDQPVGEGERSAIMATGHTRHDEEGKLWGTRIDRKPSRNRRFGRSWIGCCRARFFCNLTGWHASFGLPLRMRWPEIPTCSRST